MEQPDSPIYRYHDGTKHHFNRFARSLGYLDWATQPRPFRSFAGSPSYPLYPAPDAHVDGYSPVAVDYHQLFEPAAVRTPLSAGAIGDLLRHSLGLSAWKVFGSSRWSLRVNPSSGNLHPTEAYIVLDAALRHYDALGHTLEQRCEFDAGAWRAAAEGDETAWLVALTSIHWREAWKYGERAFRYCQHDLGHAIAALAFAAALHGLRARLLSEWSHDDIAALTGIDRDDDYVDAEREEPGCVLVISRGREPVGRSPFVSPGPLVAAVRAGQWTGRASQLSEDHVQWTFIDEITAATRDAGGLSSQSARPPRPAALAVPAVPAQPAYPARLLLQRRSAVALDGRSSTSAAAFLRMLARVMPSPAAPWDAIWWDPRIHLLLFVHRVDDVEPGLYLLARDRAAIARLRAACGRDFLWEPASDIVPLFLLARGDCRRLAQRVSCDQEIAADGFFSLGMLADFDASLRQFGAPFYRRLFWESGLVGQTLYLEAEAAGARGTGIGFFYDDPVHDVIGLRDHAFQSLYHFTIGMPIEDTRLASEPGYGWEDEFGS